MIEHAKIILLCIVAAVVYGILHDQITAHNLHRILHSIPSSRVSDPIADVVGTWVGVVATWWVGLFLALLLTLAARAGPRPKLTATTLVHPIGRPLS